MTIIVADDHPLFRGAMRQALAEMPGSPDIVEAGDFTAAQQAAGLHPDADLLMLDLTMPGVSGFSGLMALRTEFPSLPILIVSAHDEPSTIARAIDLGACGFLSKSSGIEDIRRAIDTVIAGNLFTPDGFQRGMSDDPDMSNLIQCLKTLTPQQSRVLGMLAEGLLNKQIAYELGVSEATIKAHVSAILLKLNVDSRTQAVIQLGKITAVAA
jgi:DNA-binding NarL/FixJ family response regulator